VCIWFDVFYAESPPPADWGGHEPTRGLEILFDDPASELEQQDGGANHCGGGAVIRYGVDDGIHTFSIRWVGLLGFPYRRQYDSMDRSTCQAQHAMKQRQAFWKVGVTSRWRERLRLAQKALLGSSAARRIYQRSYDSVTNKEPPANRELGVKCGRTGPARIPRYLVASKPLITPRQETVPLSRVIEETTIMTCCPLRKGDS